MKLFTELCLAVALCIGIVESAITCGGRTSKKNIDIVNPANPPTICDYSIEAYSKSVCQLRIDFKMTLAQPTLPDRTNLLRVPKCIDDYLQIEDLKLCGVETSQHIYVPLNRTAGVKSIRIRFAITPRGGGVQLPKASWNFHITQLVCPSVVEPRTTEINELSRARSANDAFFIAPAGCDQYFPEPTGSIQSFNYNNGRGIFPYELNYAICFRRTTATTGLLLKVANFTFGGNALDPSILTQIDGACYPNIHVRGRSEDYLFVPHATIQGENVRANYFCGQSLSGRNVTSKHPGPLMILFNSDGLYPQDVKAQGFSLQYELLTR